MTRSQEARTGARLKAVRGAILTVDLARLVFVVAHPPNPSPKSAMPPALSNVRLFMIVLPD